jgi:uncharacterized protein (DUF983 family)
MCGAAGAPNITDAPSPPAGGRGAAGAAARGLCPRCGSRTLFAGWANFAPRCRACDLDFEAFNVGDGPAAFLTLIVGALMTVLAVTVDLTLRPPIWVHAILWFPLTIFAVLFSLRFAKALLLGLEYRNRAGEAKSTPAEPHGPQ